MNDINLIGEVIDETIEQRLNQLMNELDDLYDSYCLCGVIEALLVYGSLAMYMSSNVYINPCGWVVDGEAGGIDIECHCQYCTELAELILWNI